MGKLLPVLLIAGMMTTATASVYVFYYGSATATVQTPKVVLGAGPDASASCTTYPCATVAVDTTNTSATISLSLFPATAGTPTPATYYSNLLNVTNKEASASHSIKSVQITNIIATSPSDFGNITVYFCTTQTEFTAAGQLATPANCVGSFSITTTTGGSVSGTFPSSIAHGATDYIEVAAYAGSGATATNTIKFSLAIQWA